MKILKDGTKQMELTCGKCNSKLEYEQEDITYEKKEDWSTGIPKSRWVGLFKREYYGKLYERTDGYVTCPICGNKTRVKSDFKEIGEKIFSKNELEWW